MIQHDSTVQDHTETEILTGINLQMFNDVAATPEGGTPASDQQAGGDAATVVSADQNATASPDSKPDEKDSDAKSDEKPGAPEEYADFKPLEGMTYDADSAAEFKALAKELNLTQDQAQKLADLYGKNMLAMQEQQQQQAQEWATESKKAFKQKDIDLAVKTLGRFSNKEFTQFLNDTGLGNHPQMIAMFKNIGDQISEGKFVDGSSVQDKPLTLAERLYGKK